VFGERTAARYFATPTQRHDAVGFRVACIIGNS
jgi:hypothetical protein